MNKFEYVENKDTELYTLVEEVINNNYSDQEIEESFDRFNLCYGELLCESISKKELKDLLNGENLTDSQKKSKELTDRYEKLKADYEEKSAEAARKRDYKTCSDLIKAFNKEAEKINTERKKLIDEIGKDAHKNRIKQNLFLDIVGIYNFVQHGIKNVDKDKIKQLISTYGYDNTIDIVLAPIRTFVNSLKPTINNEIEEYYKETGNESIFEDVTTVLKYLKLDFLILKDNKIVWNSKSKEAIPNLIDNLMGNVETIEKKTVDEILEDIDDEKIEEVSAEEIEQNVTDNSSKESTEETKEETKSEERVEEISTEEAKEDVTDTISDNSDLITPLAKAANVTADKLVEIVSKLCKTKTGKSRKLDPGVITGLSIMICGVLLTVKKNGKNDRKAIVDIVDKLNQIIAQKKGLKKILEFREFVNTL